MNTNICPKTWLVESILVTCLCCLPFGIVGIINASKVEDCFRKGEYEQACLYSKQAAKWTKWGLISGLVYIVITIVYVFIIIFSIVPIN